MPLTGMSIGYARVSTADQNNDLQISALREAGCEKIFVEHASGAKTDRVQLKEALDYMREGDSLVVWKLDRLARSLKFLIETVEMLEGRKIGFRSLTENIDTTTPGGLLIFHVFGALAQFERAIIRERTMAGLDEARRNGRVGGRPIVMTEKDIRAAKAMLLDPKITVADVAKRLKVGTSTIYRHFPGGRSALFREEIE